MDSGFFKIHRKLFNHWLWDEKRKYSKAEAWVWLLTNARYINESTSILIKNKKLNLNYGELLYSQDRLSKEWGWVRGSVNKFLKLLENDGMIKVVNEIVITRIIVINYKKYNKKGENKETESVQVWKQFINTFGNDLETVLKQGNINNISSFEDLKKQLGNALETKRKQDSNTFGNDNDTHKKKVKKKESKESNSSSPAKKPDEVKVSHKVRIEFEKFFLEKINEEYYWTVADGSNCKQLIDKLKFRLDKRKKEYSDDNILSSFKNVLKYLPDWHLQHLSMLNINSKFNDIVIVMNENILSNKNNSQKDDIDEVGH